MVERNARFVLVLVLTMVCGLAVQAAAVGIDDSGPGASVDSASWTAAILGQESDSLLAVSEPTSSGGPGSEPAVILGSARDVWSDSPGLGSVSASSIPAIPEASVFLLGPAGMAAVVALERRRRRLSQTKHGVGILYYALKRSFDVFLSMLLLLVSAPVFAAIALLVRLDSPGCVLFRRRVIGKHGKPYDMYKFRSMVANAESVLEQDEDLRKAYYVNCKLEHDPRVTRVGRILRKTSLDELPQLLNVFLGNMTFVGPRPIHHDEVEIYGPCVEQFKTVTPGITGIWQTCGRSETSYESRVEMDMRYIRERSILLDLWIILNTVPAVLLKRGAC